MFYSIQILGRKTALGKLWMAAHADRRLKQKEINDTSISKSVGVRPHRCTQENATGTSEGWTPSTITPCTLNLYAAACFSRCRSCS